MEKTELRRIWTWFRSQLDARLVTNVTVGMVLGLLVLEGIKLLFVLVGAVVGILALLLFG